jgi:low temperature requirement protein LtrA
MKFGAYLNILAGSLVMVAGVLMGDFEKNMFLFFPLGVFFLGIGMLYLWRIRKEGEDD